MRVTTWAEYGLIVSLHVEDRTQAVVYALKRGWVQLNNSNIKTEG